MEHNRPIFVVGAPRSGTSLLQRMLRSHPQISSPTGESQFIVPLIRNAADYGDLSVRENLSAVLTAMHRISTEFMETDLPGIHFDIDAIASAIHARGACTMPVVIDALFRLNAEGEGKSRWLDKTPYYTLHMPLLAETFPSSQFVHIIRDGRDTTLSMLERAIDIRVFNSAEGARLWSHYVDAGKRAGEQLGPDRYLEFRYEDMLEYPENTIRRVCEFLGEKFSGAVIDFQKSTDPNSKTPLLKKGLQKSNCEKWRSKMTAHQLRVFESVAGDTLLSCGYVLSGPIKPLNFLERGAYDLHQRFMARFNPHPKDPKLKR